MGGWVANSKHDFFSIKNYDIIKGGWVTDFHVIIFKLSFLDLAVAKSLQSTRTVTDADDDADDADDDADVLTTC